MASPNNATVDTMEYRSGGLKHTCNAHTCAVSPVPAGTRRFCHGATSASVIGDGRLSVEPMQTAERAHF